MLAPAHVGLILLGWALAGGSPGPATLAISQTAMSHGRRAALTLAAGITCGSASWGVAAGLGLSAVMLANAWMFEGIRYAGAGYLLFLALKSLKRAARPWLATAAATGRRRLFARGMLLHLTNPKAVLAWGAIYAIALPPGAGGADVWTLFLCLISVSATVFHGYALLFSIPRVARGYARLRRWFDGAFGALFGVASFEILTARLRV
ncbi:LysE family transporter [Acidimangrovimonas pyrenivorans]|uniref:LysE family transporter n=1 Tax=Acidimangrovimonas pyrenivorans TaxID=2030798 RepID=A0ABV7AKG6_9RHOB